MLSLHAVVSYQAANTVIEIPPMRRAKSSDETGSTVASYPHIPSYSPYESVRSVKALMRVFLIFT